MSEYESSMDAPEVDVSGLSVDEVEGLIGSGEVQLVDVREPDEWEAGHIAGAVHIPLNDLTARADSLDRDRQLVFYCRGDGRSGMASEAFTAAGFKADKLARGIVGWVESGKPIEPPNGEVVNHAGFPRE